MYMHTSFKRRFFFFVVAFTIEIFIFQQTKPVFAQTSCLNLSRNLSYGDTDQTYGGPVLSLQDYLQSLGYLHATPNGHFGPATLAAAKEYQAANGIPSTGYVGPLTRASLKTKTCSVPVTSTPASVSQPVTTTIPSSSESFSGGITSPATGQVLAIGSSTVITWQNPPSGTFNISLEQPGGAGAGFVASNLSPTGNSNQYVWKVGSVYSSQTNSNTTIQPGTYRLRLQSSTYGASSNDMVSGWFTVVAPQFSVSSIVPSVGYADDTSSVVLLGSGFTPATTVYFDNNYSSLRGNNQYISPDGSVLVFTVPTSVPIGTHILYINNGQSSNPVTIPFRVTAM